MELYDELQTKIDQLNSAIRDLRKNGTAYAQAERNYKVKLREEILKLREEGMAVGIIDKTCYGIPVVADLRFERDVAKTVYEANLEAVASIKLQMRLLENQISREFGVVRYEM